MQRVVMAIVALLLCVGAIAAPNNTPNSIILNAIKNNVNSSNLNHSPSFVYGGQDISTEIANADVSVWSGQPILVG